MNAIEEQPTGTELEPLPTIVLLVEDEVLIRLDLSDELRDSGCTVYEAGTADMAMELLKTPMRVDVVVTDVRMPGNTNGMDLAALVRENRPTTKVVVMSGDHIPDDEEQHLFDGFFPKPFDSRSLVKTIKALQNSFGSASERASTNG